MTRTSVNTSPLGSLIVSLTAPASGAITWLFVTITPDGETTNPLPREVHFPAASSCWMSTTAGGVDFKNLFEDGGSCGGGARAGGCGRAPRAPHRKAKNKSQHTRSTNRARKPSRRHKNSYTPPTL